MPFSGPTNGFDRIAAQNFALLGGQLRVSFTPRCNIRCWFCHNEGDVPPIQTHENRREQPRPRILEASDYTAIIDSMLEAGFRRIFFTGGEPLVSPLARPVLEKIPRHEESQFTTTLITNGLLIKRNIDWLKKVALDRIKISLHYFSDESLQSIAGASGIARIKEGVEIARDSFKRVEINTLLQKQNEHEIFDIIEYARSLGVSIQIIELVDTDFNEKYRDSAVSTSALVNYLQQICTVQKISLGGTGQGKRVFRVGDINVEVIEKSLGRYHVGQCGSCPLRPQCVEGFWALRVDSSGLAAPCLLREDLRLDLKPHIADKAALQQAVAAHLESFTEGSLTSAGPGLRTACH